MKTSAYTWPKGKIPFKFDANVKHADKLEIIKVMDLIQSKTCLRFLETLTAPADNRYLR